MKNLLLIILMSLCPVIAAAQEAEMNTYGLSQADYEALGNAVRLVDKGLADLAIQDFDRIVAANPGNYMAQYERMYALCKTGRYADALKDYKKILKHPEATAITYHLICVALAKENRINEEQKVLKEGLKRFPDAGVLYMLAGSEDLERQKVEEALRNYNLGIDRDPMFWKNYLLASMILCQNDELKPWGLVYAETAMLLSRGKPEEQFMSLAALIRECYLNSVKIFPDSVSVAMAPKREIITLKKIPDDADAVAYPNSVLGFPGVYTDCTNLAAQEMAHAGEQFTASIDQLARLRKGIVENYYDKAAGMFGDAMYLFPFQKSVIDAGHWETYNYFLFGYLFPDEYIKWLDANEGKLNEFHKWYTDGKYVLGDGHTVGMDSIFNGCKIFPLIGSMYIQALLLGGKPEDPKEIIKFLVDSPTVIDMREIPSGK